jgi:hypothetical protein
MRLLSMIPVAALALAAAMPVHAVTRVFTTILSGAAESPPNGSGGTGSALVTIDDSAFTMHVEASFSGLSAPNTAAHIHCCTATPITGTAGVATSTPTFTSFPSGVTSGTYDHTFDMMQAASWNAAFITASGGTPALAFSAFLAGMIAGDTYFNIHTSLNPGGEIRGFLAPLPEPQTYALMLAGLAAIGVAARRRPIPRD